MLEDAARFLATDAALCSAFKSARHDLRAALDRLPPGVLIAARDAATDPGTSVSLPSEGDRRDRLAVVEAAGKRAAEALRALEEWSKLARPEIATVLESIRYRTYDLERDLITWLGSGRAEQWPVCVLLTEALCHRSWTEVLDGAIAGGAACIQVREKDVSTRSLTTRVRAVVEVARPQGVAVVVNDRVDVALAAGADGAHLGVDDLALDDARRLVGRGLLLGASTHDAAEANAAVGAGADYCGVGAMFPTALKPGRSPSGIAWLRAYLARHAATPHLAIGGITPENVGELAAAGARGVAVSGAVCGAHDPAAAVAALASALTPAGTTVTT